MLTEVTITEGDSVIRYAQYCPSGQVLHDWLSKLVCDMLFADHSLRIIYPAGTTLQIDRANVTAVDITRSHSG